VPSSFTGGQHATLPGVSRTTASLTVAAVAVAWGFIPLIVKEVELPALALVFFRVALGAIALAAAFLAGGRAALLRLPSRVLLVLGILLAAHWGLYFAAIKETSVASAVLITYTAPVFTALLAPVFLREHVPRSSLVALALSLAGAAAITLVGDDGAVRLLGVALALGAAVTYAMLLVSLKRLASDIDPRTVTFWYLTAAAVVLSPAAVVADYSLDGEQVLYLLVLGVVLTGFLIVLYVGAVQVVPATSAGILGYMEPVSAAVLAALLIGEALTWNVVAGGAAILAGGVIVVIASRGDVPTAIDEPVR
jgi:drug/metabolite transporter (DMT)-like permease